VNILFYQRRWIDRLSIRINNAPVDARIIC